MFVGHLAVALGAKRVAPRVNLGWFVASVIALDLLWPVFLLLGVEHVRVLPGATAFTPFIFDAYPWSHSLAMAAAWGLALAAVARWRRLPAASALFVGLVVSHWILDVVTHAPDLPLWPGTSPRFGFGLWNSVPATLVVEGALWVTAIAFYVRRWPARGWASSVAFWSLVVATTTLWAAGPWSAPPPTIDALAWVALAAGLVTIPWAAVADRGRRVVGSDGGQTPRG